MCIATKNYFQFTSKQPKIILNLEMVLNKLFEKTKPLQKDQLCALCTMMAITSITFFMKSFS